MDKEYGDTFSLVDYFELLNTANIYAKQVELGEILTNVIVIMSFDEELGYNPQLLGSKSSLKGVPFEEGGGYRINWRGDRYLQ